MGDSGAAAGTKGEGKGQKGTDKDKEKVTNDQLKKEAIAKNERERERERGRPSHWSAEVPQTHDQAALANDQWVLAVLTKVVVVKGECASTRL